MTQYHSDDLGIHRSSYVQGSDPGAVGAHKTWIDTSSGPPYLQHVRNAGNTGWDDVGAVGPVGAWVQGGNSFGADGAIGTLDDRDIHILRHNLEFIGLYDTEIDMAATLFVNPLGLDPTAFEALQANLFPVVANAQSIAIAGLMNPTQPTGTFADVQGVRGAVEIGTSNAATITLASGVVGNVLIAGTGPVTKAVSVRGEVITHGLSGSTVVPTTAISIYGEAQTIGTTNWSGYFESGVFVGDRFGVGAAPDATQAATIRHANWPGSADAEGLYVHTVVNTAGSHLFDAIRAAGEAANTTGTVTTVNGIVASAALTAAGHVNGLVPIEVQIIASAGTVDYSDGLEIDSPTLSGGATIDTAYGIYVNNQLVSGVTDAYGLFSESQIFCQIDVPASGTAIGGIAHLTGTGSTMSGYGVSGVLEAGAGSGTVLDGAAVRGLGLMLGGVNATVLAGVRGDMQNGSSGTIADARVVEARAITNTGGGSVTNAVGIYAEDQTVGTHNYAILANGYVEVDESTQGIAFQAFESFTTSGSGDFVNAVGVSASANGSGTGAQVEGLDVTALIAGSTAAAYIYGAGIHLANDSSGVATDMHGVHIDAIQNGGGGSVTNAIGLYAEAQTVGTNNWSIYANGAVAIEGLLRLKEISTPATPPSGEVCIYVKSDHKLYRKDSTGTETLIG